MESSEIIKSGAVRREGGGSPVGVVKDPRISAGAPRGSPSANCMSQYDMMRSHGRLISKLREDPSEDIQSTMLNRDGNEQVYNLHSSENSSGSSNSHCEGQGSVIVVDDSSSSDIADHELDKSHRPQHYPSTSSCDYISARTSGNKTFPETDTAYRPFMNDIPDNNSHLNSLTIYPYAYTNVNQTREQQAAYCGQTPKSCDYTESMSPSSSDSKGQKMAKTGGKQLLWGCAVCNFKGINKWTLENHVKTHREKTKFSCSVCHYYFANASALESHWKGHQCDSSKEQKRTSSNVLMENRTGPHGCQPNESSNSHYLKNRFGADSVPTLQCWGNTNNNPEPENPVNAPLKSSGRPNDASPAYLASIQDKTNLNDNCDSTLSKSNNKETLFSCPSCAFSTNDNRNLLTHVEQHLRESPFQCKVCKLSLASAFDLEYHLRSLHYDGGNGQSSGAPYQSGPQLSDNASRYFYNMHKHPEAYNKQTTAGCDYSLAGTPNVELPGSDTGRRPFKHGKTVHASMKNSKRTNDTVPEHFKGHQKVNTEGPFRCVLCIFTTNNEQNLLNHLDIHVRETPFQCKVCEYYFENALFLETHLRGHHNDGASDQISGANPSRKPQYPQKKVITTCWNPPKCDGTARVGPANALKAKRGSSGAFPDSADCIHPKERKSTHIGEKPFSCGICFFSTASKLYLEKHVRLHYRKTQFCCVLCKCYFRNTSALEDHCKGHHEKQKCVLPNPFNEPNLKGDDDSSNLHHPQTASCDYTLNAASNLKGSPQSSASKGPFLRDNIPTYVSPARSIGQTNAGVGPGLICASYTFPYNVGNYISTYPTYLSGHTGEKVYSCAVCDFRTNDEWNILNHERTHLLRTSFVCLVCRYYFASGYDLESHLRKNHCDANKTQIIHSKPSEPVKENPDVCDSAVYISYHPQTSSQAEDGTHVECDDADSSPHTQVRIWDGKDSREACDYAATSPHPKIRAWARQESREACVNAPSSPHSHVSSWAREDSREECEYTPRSPHPHVSSWATEGTHEECDNADSSPHPQVSSGREELHEVCNYAASSPPPKVSSWATEEESREQCDYAASSPYPQTSSHHPQTSSWVREESRERCDYAASSPHPKVSSWAREDSHEQCDYAASSPHPQASSGAEEGPHEECDHAPISTNHPQLSLQAEESTHEECDYAASFLHPQVSSGAKGGLHEQCDVPYAALSQVNFLSKSDTSFMHNTSTNNHTNCHSKSFTKELHTPGMDDSDLMTQLHAGEANTSASQAHAAGTHSDEKLYLTPEFSDYDSTESQKITFNEQESFLCEFCAQTFVAASDFESHIRHHTDDKPFSPQDARDIKSRDLRSLVDGKYACGICDFKTPYLARLKGHRRHAGEKPFECTECGYASSYRTCLKQHMVTNFKIRPFACRDCDFKTAFSGLLKRHESSHYGKTVLRFACRDCDFKTAFSRVLKKHERSHNGKNLMPFACRDCDFKTPFSGVLKKHESSHNGKNLFSCTECDYKCDQNRHLRAHMKTHSDEDPVTPTCYVCGHESTDLSTLKDHMQAHSKDNPLSGNACDSKSSNVTKAGTTKTFKCEICAYTFTTAVKLERHKNRMKHNIVGSDKFAEKRRMMYSGFKY